MPLPYTPDRELQPPEHKDCPFCEGTGKSGTSSCCGAELNSDMMICYECKDHCDEDECSECDGTGTID